MKSGVPFHKLLGRPHTGMRQDTMSATWREERSTVEMNENRRTPVWVMMWRQLHADESRMKQDCAYCPMSWCLFWRSWCAAALSLLIMTMFRPAQHHHDVALICTYVARQETRVNFGKTHDWFAPYLCTGWDIPRRNSFGRDALSWRYSLIKQANWRHIVSLWHSWSNFTFSTWRAKHHA
jgi:hypothetical protein